MTEAEQRLDRSDCRALDHEAEVSDLPMCDCGRDRVMGLATMKCAACWPSHVYERPEE